MAAEGNTAKSWMTINIFSGTDSSPDTNPAPAKSEDGFFSRMKNKLYGTGDSIRSTASNIYHRDYKLFAITLGSGAALIFMSLFFLPLAPIAPQKFCLLFTLGSLCVLSSFAFLQNPYEYVISLFSGSKLIFTGCYLVSLIFSLYASLIAKSYIATIFATVCQVCTVY